MKTLRKRLIEISSFVLVTLLAIPTPHAQTVLPNVRVNTNDYDKVSLDGGAKPIAVVNDMVYAVWQGEPTSTTSNIYFSKSTDQGATFSLETLVYDGPASILHVFPSLFVAQNGNIYITWTAITDNEANWNVWFSKSTNGGATFQTPVQITNDNASVYSCIAGYGDNVYIFYADATNYPMADYHFVRSTNNGDSFETSIQINDATTLDGIEFDAVNTIAVDQSGNIYLAWVDGRRADGNGDIFFTKSTDNGQSFGTNIMVNDVSELGADSIQHNPSITVDNSDNVYVSFTDKRLGSDWPVSRVYMAKSSNGGGSFATESLLAGHDGTCKSHDLSANASGKLSAAMCTNVVPAWGTWLFESADGGNNFFTPVALNDASTLEYSEVRVLLKPDDEVCAIWKDDRTGTNNLYFTKTDLATSVADLDGENQYVLYPNPTNGQITIDLNEMQNSVVIDVFNSMGKLLFTEQQASAQLLNIQLPETTGIYFIRLTSTAGHVQNLKVVKE